MEITHLIWVDWDTTQAAPEAAQTAQVSNRSASHRAVSVANYMSNEHKWEIPGEFLDINVGPSKGVLGKQLKKKLIKCGYSTLHKLICTT